MEVFKDLNRYNGYRIGSNGNVFSYKSNKILKQDKDSKGYMRVFLSIKGKKKTIRVHVLVAEEFLGHITNGSNYIVIDHIDNNKTNNNIDNLQIISQRENSIKDKDFSKKTSKFIGVSYDKDRDKWVAEIRNKRKRYRLGRFEDEESAHDAYLSKLKEINETGI